MEQIQSTTYGTRTGSPGKIIAVVIMASFMCVLGLALLRVFYDLHTTAFGFGFTLLLSNVGWLLVFLVLRRHKSGWLLSVFLGALSPIVGSLLLHPPFGWLACVAYPYVMFPVGIATGIIVHTIAGFSTVRPPICAPPEEDPPSPADRGRQSDPAVPSGP